MSTLGGVRGGDREEPPYSIDSVTGSMRRGYDRLNEL
jgi:hypothetical protein